MNTNSFKERLYRGVGAESAAVVRFIVESMQHLILLLGTGGGELFDVGNEFADAELQTGQAFAVGFLVVDGEGGEGAVDKIDDAGFAGTGSFVGGNNARADGVDFNGLLGGEELGFRPRGGFRGFGRALRRGDDCGAMRREAKR